MITVDREKIKEKWLGSENKPTVINVPGVKIIHHMLVYGPEGSM